MCVFITEYIICRCFNADEKTRWSAKQLLDHPYIKGEQLSDDVPDKPPAGQFHSSSVLNINNFLNF